MMRLPEPAQDAAHQEWSRQPDDQHRGEHFDLRKSGLGPSDRRHAHRSTSVTTPVRSATPILKRRADRVLATERVADVSEVPVGWNTSGREGTGSHVTSAGRQARLIAARGSPITYEGATSEHRGSVARNVTLIALRRIMASCCATRRSDARTCAAARARWVPA